MSDAVVTLADGAGGKASQSLIEGLLLPALRNDALANRQSIRRTDGGAYPRRLFQMR